MEVTAVEKDFYVYMLATNKNGTIYKGITSNLIGRTWQHKNAIGSKFTSKYGLKKLVWYHHCGNWEEAVKYEKRLRRYPREWKINLIEEKNPAWNDLYEEICGHVDYTYSTHVETCNDGVFLKDISKKLKSSLEARMLVKHVTGLSDADLITNDDIPLTESQQAQLDDFIAQRLNGRPISKIIGKKEFYGRDFIVTDDVLDPRPDSETLIEAVLAYARDKNRPYHILEMGVGSGCLILTLLAELPKATAIATDISDKALDVARQNAIGLNVADRIEFVKSDWFESVEGSFDIIISNPPYIETADIENLAPDVRDYDPIQALDGGLDGLLPYKVILPQIRNYLNKGGFCALEHGAGQAVRIKEIAAETGFVESRTHYDLAGHDRVFSFLHK